MLWNAYEMDFMKCDEMLTLSLFFKSFPGGGRQEAPGLDLRPHGAAAEPAQRGLSASRGDARGDVERIETSTWKAKRKEDFEEDFNWRSPFGVLF